MPFSHATVVTAMDGGKSNYAIHYQFVVFDKLESYQKDTTKNAINNQAVLNPEFSFDLLDARKNTLSDASLDSSDDYDDIVLNRLPKDRFKNPLSTPTEAGQRIPLTSSHDTDEIADDMSVGTFLDSFRNDPLLQTIYFSSRDLTFSYQNRLNNILQLGFDMEAEDYSRYKTAWNKREEMLEKSLTSKEHQAIEQEAKILFGMISESYTTILYVILGMILGLYLIFRYVLSKYL